MALVEVKNISYKYPNGYLAVDDVSFSIEAGENVVLRAVGASAVNQMYKGISVARGTLASKGSDLFIKPGFDEVTENDEKKTVMVAHLIIQ